MSVRKNVSKICRCQQAVILTSQKVALKMLGMEVSLCAVRARKFAICVLDRNHGVLSASTSGWGSRPSRSTRQNTASSLRSNNVSGRLALWHHRSGLHKRTRTIRRRDTRLGHDASRGHRTQHRRTSTASRSRRDRLWVRRGSGRLGHHSRGAISLGRRILVLGH